MKPNFYKTNGSLDVETSSIGGIVFLRDDKDVIILEKPDVEFLIKCFNELLEE